MQDSYPYPYTHVNVPVPVPMVPDPGILKIIFTLQIKWVRRLLYCPTFLFVCFLSCNFWNSDKKIEYLWWNILIYKDKNRHSILPFHIVNTTLFFLFPILIKHCASTSPPPHHFLIWGISATEQSWMALDSPVRLQIGWVGFSSPLCSTCT